ncbi:hypothetical protein TREMEDRAFT_45974 [Tremella mesenterica DSM 1558]|uniref:uncharacterized protein n=1 Tax=Tremella mesenterica (strain ATCC 24925 / CBS 8224 / DSM 1558 / NBRC 9311 / NRRL Y-6157 / RJB 2259-6 / UBC 559-6) TaxID=578456 RepID=UPI00032D3341|nr:uncharacterized protein TREMEDRAFT_45974 [Tremella mesenterica DSM 1558]EIW65985.1 hypothetical protein TREMEDRAFT_45974 [Tremella mesenterica DSM 1558]
MFKKPLANQSNFTPIRSSARRQLLSSIFTQYPSLLRDIPSASVLPDGGSGDVRPRDDRPTEKDIGRMILPEGVKSGTFETSAGVEGTMYTSGDGEPLWISFGRKSSEFVPTLSLLALPLTSPPLPILQLPHPLPPPLFTGAPLFLGAVRNLHRPHLLPDVKEGEVVALVSPHNGEEGEVVYVGVSRVVAPGGLSGALERRKRNLEQGVEREEGRFAEILCIVDDYLWKLGSKPSLSPFHLLPPQNPLAPNPEHTPSSSAQHQKLAKLSFTEEEQSANKPVQPLSPTEISTLLSVSLLQALSTLDPSQLPMPASLLYSAHVLPSRPAYIPKEQRDDVVIGKSEWKRLAKWMKEVSKDGLIKTKESKGEVVIVSVDQSHPALDGHKGHLTVAEEDRKAAKRAMKEAEGDNMRVAEKGMKGELKIEELWRPTGANVGFWEECGVDKSVLHPPALLKTALEDYISKHNLVNPHQRQSVHLDETLGRVCGIKKIDPGQMLTREEIIKRLRAGVSWSVSIGGVVKKGNLQPITLTVKTRQGRKTVTIISGLESFNIVVEEFAEEMRKLCAGSASVQPLSGASPKLNLSEVVVQGTQVRIITDALIDKGVPRRWIKEGDGDKKK